MKYILALDQGTTSSRTIVFDEGMNIVSLAQREFRQIYPQPGWVEHDPFDILSTQTETMREAVAKAGIDPRDIAASGHHQPARDGRRVGQEHGQARLQRDRVAVPALRGDLRAPPGGRPRGRDRQPHGAARGRLFFRHEGQVDAGQRARRARGGRSGQACSSAPWTRGSYGT